MAENEAQFQDRTEQATPKRLEEARNKGQIPRSKELNMAAVLAMGALALYADRDNLGGRIREMMTRSLTIDRAALDDPGYMTEALTQAAFSALAACTPLLLALAVAAVHLDPEAPAHAGVEGDSGMGDLTRAHPVGHGFGVEPGVEDALAGHRDLPAHDEDGGGFVDGGHGLSSMGGSGFGASFESR